MLPSTTRPSARRWSPISADSLARSALWKGRSGTANWSRPSLPVSGTGKVVNELYVDDLRANTHRGVEGRVARGMSAGARHPSTQYRVDHRPQQPAIPPLTIHENRQVVGIARVLYVRGHAGAGDHLRPLQHGIHLSEVDVAEKGRTDSSHAIDNPDRDGSPEQGSNA